MAHVLMAEKQCQYETQKSYNKYRVRRQVGPVSQSFQRRELVDERVTARWPGTDLRGSQKIM